MRYELTLNATPIERAFHAADAEWFQQLREKFGDLANVARFQARGEGEPGTELHKAYLTYCVARDRWLEEVERENRQIAAQLSQTRLRSDETVARAARLYGREF